MIHSVAILLAFIALGQAKPDADRDLKTFTRLEEVWNEAHVKGDAEALDRLWAEELVVTVPNMVPMTKAQSLGVWKSGRFKFERYQSSDLRAKVFGDAAVVTGRLQRSRTIGERKLEDDWLFTKVYVRSKDTWQVVAFHASPSPPGK